jgi:pSer/pThr/pTyr-binding forkhead associated (FHA) protein
MAALAAVSYRRVERRFATGHLSLVRGRGTKNELDIKSTVTLGRDERNTIGLFKDESIEQKHAEVLLENGNYVIEDKSSNAGTYVNKRRVTGRQALQDGDVIEMGHSTIVFSAGSAQSCAGCGSTVRTNAKFCPKCGVKAIKIHRKSRAQRQRADALYPYTPCPMRHALCVKVIMPVAK